VDSTLVGGNQEKPFEHLGDAPGAILRMGLLDGDHTVLDLWLYGRLAARPRLWCQSLDTATPVCKHPAPDRMLTDAELLTDH
jgi:hypothetical protein